MPYSDKERIRVTGDDANTRSGEHNQNYYVSTHNHGGGMKNATHKALLLGTAPVKKKSWVSSITSKEVRMFRQTGELWCDQKKGRKGLDATYQMGRGKGSGGHKWMSLG